MAVPQQTESSHAERTACFATSCVSLPAPRFLMSRACSACPAACSRTCTASPGLAAGHAMRCAQPCRRCRLRARMPPVAAVALPQHGVLLIRPCSRSGHPPRMLPLACLAATCLQSTLADR